MSDQSVALPKDGSRPGTPWWIRGTSFAVVESPQTYDEDTVLRLREALAVAVETWHPVTPVIAAANLTPSGDGRGCDAPAVDQWLAMVRAAMNEGMAAPVVPDSVVPQAVAPEPTAPADVVGEAEPPDTVARITDVRFAPLRFRLGYVMSEVDDFLDVLVAAVSAGEPIAGLVEEVSFSQSRMKECYPVEEVEAFLVELVRDHEGATLTR